MQSSSSSSHHFFFLGKCCTDTISNRFVSSFLFAFFFLTCHFSSSSQRTQSCLLHGGPAAHFCFWFLCSHDQRLRIIQFVFRRAKTAICQHQPVTTRARRLTSTLGHASKTQWASARGYSAASHTRASAIDTVSGYFLATALL